jgi:hypothetical protein
MLSSGCPPLAGALNTKGFSARDPDGDRTREDTPTRGLNIVRGLSDRALVGERTSRGGMSSRGTAGRAEYEVVVCTTGAAEAAGWDEGSESSPAVRLLSPLLRPNRFWTPLLAESAVFAVAASNFFIVPRRYSCGGHTLYTRARQTEMPKMALYLAITIASRLATRLLSSISFAFSSSFCLF